METWSFERALAFCLAHAKQRVTVRQRGTTLRLTGRMAALGERDACSMDLVEADLDLGISGLHCTLSLHETTLLVHLSGSAADTGAFVPVSIPYEDLVLAEGEVAQPAPGTQPRSPYELL
jgi:hypothetical protein